MPDVADVAYTYSFPRTLSMIADSSFTTAGPRL